MKSLKTDSLQFGSQGKLNGEVFNDIVMEENPEELIQGNKSFGSMKVKQIEADTINGVSCYSVNMSSRFMLEPGKSSILYVR